MKKIALTSIGIEGVSQLILDIEEIGPNDIGMKKSVVEQTVQKKLLDVGIDVSESAKFTGEGIAFLYVRVSIVGNGFNVHTDIRRVVYFADQEGTFYAQLAPTWMESITGTHGNDARYILDAVERLTGMFIDQYMRVSQNESLRTRDGIKV
jgi:hypothetical protein